MFLFCATRNGVSAKEIQRQTGVTYKAAWRMGHEIRKYMTGVDGDDPLGGQPIVEADEAFVGGHRRGGYGGKGKTIVFGIVERGGEVITRVLQDRREITLIPHLKTHVLPGTRIATDEHRSYSNLAEDGYRHASVNHSQKEYVRGPVHTNTIEGF